MSRRLPTRLVLWSLVVGALFGIFGIAEPLDHVMRAARNLSRAHPGSGRIVFVGIDDATLARMAEWPLPREAYARTIDRMFALGATRVFVDLDLSSPSNPASDAALEAALARHDKKVVLAAAYYLDPSSDKRTDRLPLARFMRYADIANINANYDSTGAVWRLAYAVPMQSGPMPSFAAKLSGVGGGARSFPIDFSINPRTIPTVSMIGLLDGSVSGREIAGRQVVLGLHTNQVPDFYFAPGYGRIAGAYFQILGAETLWERRPIDGGWALLYGLSGVVLLVSFATGRNIRTIATLLTNAAILVLLPFVLDRFLIFVDIMPALVLIGIPIVTLVWREIRIRFRTRATTNALSGLLNLNALRLETVDLERQLVVARVHNYAAVIAMLPSEAEEKALIAQIASRLTLGAPGLQLYQGDDGVFAWLTGEEGAVLEGHLDALHALFRSPTTVAGSSFDLAITFGIDSGRDRSIANRFGSALVAASEAAADGAKYKEYDAAKLKDAAWKLSLLGQLDAAIDGGDLWVAYQPKLDLASNRIVGAEALVRWTHREKGDISPMEFIVAAEQHNRIEKLTMHVMERAITAAAAINAHGIPFNIAVNLSVRLLEDASLPGTILALLVEHGLSPTALTLEITETAAMTAHHGLDVLRELRDHGIKISIDDYGTGLSTLEYLKKIPASEIKIDKSFIQAMTDSASDLLLVNSTIQLAHSLGHRVVAEGVEQPATLARLTEMGCDTVQGYLIGRPMTFQALSRRLMSDQRHAA